MNRADIRQAIFDQIDWQPDTSADLTNKLDRFINRAYNQLALEAPFLFFEDKVSFLTQTDISSATAITNDRVTQETTNTPGLVWKRAYSVSADRTPSGDDADIVQWDPDPATYVAAGVPHPFEGRTIEITGSDDRVYRRKIRKIWWEEAVGTHTDYITLDKPLDLSVEGLAVEYTDLKYRITTPSYYLPADVIEVRSIRIWDEERREPVSLIYTEEAEEQWWDDVQGSNSSGSPRKAFRTDYFQMPSPVYKPLTALDPTNAWNDEYSQPQGAFDFFYTICWGALDKKDVVTKGAANVSRHRRPKFESSPSPISDAQGINDATASIALTLPDIDAPRGFTTDTAGDIEYGRSGLWKRIYARRVSSSRPSTSTMAIVENPDDFFYVGYVDGQSTSFVFSGFLVNFEEPYRELHGYSGLQISPLPDAAYTVDVRCLRKPYPLETDQSVPRVPPEAMDVLIHKILVIVYESLGHHEIAAVSQAVYSDRLVTLKKRYGSLPSGVFRKRLGRSRGYGRRGYRFLVDER